MEDGLGSNIRLSVRLGMCSVELHCGTVLGSLSLLSLAVTKLRRILGKNSFPKNITIEQFDITPTQSQGTNSKWVV